MFALTELQSRKNIKDEDLENVMNTLRYFSNAIAEICDEIGIGRGETPFTRPSNFLVVLDINQLHLVVDDVPVGIPNHYYYDMRQERKEFNIDEVISDSKRELGFSHPVGLDFPISILDINDEDEKKRQLQNEAERICEQQIPYIKIINNIPQWSRHLERFIPEFCRDNPDFEKNVFLMIRFKSDVRYKTIENTIKEQMKSYGLKVLKADDKAYTDDLWENVCLYMLGCNYGIAVFEDIDERDFNPNIVLELGFMLALNKRCLILKEKTLPKMPADIVGKLYKEFDFFNIESSISDQIKRWANDIGLDLAL